MNLKFLKSILQVTNIIQATKTKRNEVIEVFEKNKKVYDRMIIRLLPDGPNTAIYFDMSDVTNDLISTMTLEDMFKQ